MKYIGPDYNEVYGITLPGTDNSLKPRLMSDGQIGQLLQYYPHLSSYFGAGTNTSNTVGTATPDTGTGTGGDKHHLHSQATPESVWLVQHNLGKNPAVTIVDSGGTEVMGEVVHNSNLQLEIRFSAVFAGTVYCN